MVGFKFRLYAPDGDDLGTRTFSEPNWQVGDTVALRDHVYEVRDVVYLNGDGDITRLLQIELRGAQPPK
jgi:hypothetical protein